MSAIASLHHPLYASQRCCISTVASLCEPGYIYPRFSTPVELANLEGGAL
jgi:hypothetical protein